MDDAQKQEIGELIRARLEDGLTVEISYEPGDMTRYELVFNRVATNERLHGIGGIVGLGNDRSPWVLVSLLNCGTRGSAAVFALLEGDPGHPSYISEKLIDNESSAHALHELFAHIAGVAPWVTQADFQATA